MKNIRNTAPTYEDGYSFMKVFKKKKNKKLIEIDGHITCYDCNHINPIKDLKRNLCIECGSSLPFIY